MLHSGYEDQSQISAVETLVKRIRFERPEDNEILLAWFEEFKELVNLPAPVFNTTTDHAGRVYPDINSPQLPIKFATPLEQLREIKQALDQQDEKLARKKLYRLTGKLDTLGFFALVCGVIFILVMVTMIVIRAFNVTPSQVPQNEVERIKEHFKNYNSEKPEE